MTTETLTLTAPIATTEMAAKDAAYALHDALRKTGLVAAWNKADTAGTPQGFFTERLGLESREQYIAFRDTLKAWIKALAANQKELKRLMSEPGGDSSAQWRKDSGADWITDLIEIRRAGKAWSAQARAAKAAA